MIRMKMSATGMNFFESTFINQDSQWHIDYL